MSLPKKLSIAVGFILLAAILFYQSSWLEPLHPDNFVRTVKSVPDSWSVFGLFLLAFVAGSWILFPLTITSIASVLVFPLWKAILCTLLGTFLSGTVSYLAGRYGLSITEYPRFKKHFDVVKKEINDYGYWAIAAMRLAPQPPFIATSVLSGALKINFPKYMIATFVGLAPMMVIGFIFGKKALDLMQDPSWIAATAVVGVVIVFAVFLVLKKVYLKKREQFKKNRSATVEAEAKPNWA